MKEETQLATKSHQESMIALAQEKDILENRYSSQIEQLEEVIVDFDKELQTNTEDLEMTKKEARLTQKELKVYTYGNLFLTTVMRCLIMFNRMS